MPAATIFGLVLVLGLGAAPATDSGPAKQRHKRSRRRSPPTARRKGDSFERKRTDALLKAEGLERAAHPEGKKVAYIRIFRDQVFVKGEVFPTWLNIFHVRSREQIVARELLIAEGEPYSDKLVEESMRNLRRMGLFSVVRIEAVQTEDPNSVGLLVHTRDIWSLRVETGFNITTQINNLEVRLVERNIAGLGHSLALEYNLAPDIHDIAHSYYVRRIMGKPLSLLGRGGVIINRAHGHAEGGHGRIFFGRPFFKLSQRYAFTVESVYRNEVQRRLSQGKPAGWVPEGEEHAAALRVWDHQQILTTVDFSLRRGKNWLHTITTSATYDDRQYRINEESGVPSSLVNAFEREVLPQSRREAGPGISYEFAGTRFKTFTDLDSYGQSENIRMGPYAAIGARTPLKILGSSVQAAVFDLTLGWTGSMQDALFRVVGRIEGRRQWGGWQDQRFQLLVRAASGQMGPFRLVGRLRLSMRRNDTTHALVSLGSDNGLRGYKSQQLKGFGIHDFLVNLEMRTKPLEWRGVLLGGVLFYDFGSVFENRQSFRVGMHYSVGIGIRLMLPQINTLPWSADAGFRLPSFRIEPTLQSGQVVPMRP